MATREKTKKRDLYSLSGIQSYAELEASLRVVEREIERSAVTRQMSFFSSGHGLSLRWTDVALLLIRALRRPLLQKKKKK